MVICKRTAEDFLSTADIAIPFSRIDNDIEKIIKEFNELRKVVDGIGEVKCDNDLNNISTEPLLIFSLFPFTLSKVDLQRFYN